jgi:5-formyltetrahydrofolate cyclo-ligase
LDRDGQKPGPTAAKLAKKELRLAIRARVAALSARERRDEEDALLARFARLPGLAQATRVLLFVPAFAEEPRASELFSAANALNKQVFYPRADRAERRLRLHHVADPSTELTRGVLGIPEPHADLREVPPDQIDWVLVPGLAFDERGYRLGRGGGYYDRLLPLLRPDAICWALCLSCQLVSRLPVEAYDQPLSGVSTPERQLLGARPHPNQSMDFYVETSTQPLTDQHR